MIKKLALKTGPITFDTGSGTEEIYFRLEDVYDIELRQYNRDLDTVWKTIDEDPFDYKDFDYERTSWDVAGMDYDTLRSSRLKEDQLGFVDEFLKHINTQTVKNYPKGVVDGEETFFDLVYVDSDPKGSVSHLQMFQSQMTDNQKQIAEVLKKKEWKEKDLFNIIRFSTWGK